MHFNSTFPLISIVMLQVISMISFVKKKKSLLCHVKYLALMAAFGLYCSLDYNRIGELYYCFAASWAPHVRLEG